jgi:hypothetical protein
VSRARDDDLRVARQIADAADAITMAHYTGSAASPLPSTDRIGEFRIAYLQRY